MEIVVFKMGLQLDLKICKLTQFKERRRLEDAMPIKIKLQIQLRLFEPVQVPGLDLAKNENSMNYYPYVKCKKYYKVTMSIYVSRCD